MTDTLQPPPAPDQTAPQAPARQVFRFNADLGGRPVEAVIEAASQQEADQYYRDQVLPKARENLAIRTVYQLQDEQSNTRGFAFNQPDEAAARAALSEIYMINQRAREFVEEVDRVDQLIEGQYDDDELANVLEETRRLQAEAPAEPDEQMRFSPLALARDVATGASELPVQVLSGAAAGVNEMADTVQETANALTEISTMPVWLENMLIPGARFANEEAAAGRVAEAPQILPELSPGARSTTGGIIRTLGQFAAGLGVAGQALKGWRATSMGGRVARGLTAGAIADFSAFDQAEDRLSDFIQTVPELQNPITEWLAGDEDDAALEGRLKNAIEGGLIGLPFEFAPEIVRAVSGLRRMRAAARQVRTEQRTIASQALSRQAQLAEESRAAEDLLGDADAPLIDIVSEQPARAADPLGEAMVRSRQGLDQAGVEGSQIEAEGLSRAAAAARAVGDQPAPMQAGGEVVSLRPPVPANDIARFLESPDFQRTVEVPPNPFPASRNGRESRQEAEFVDRIRDGQDGIRADLSEEDLQIFNARNLYYDALDYNQFVSELSSLRADLPAGFVARPRKNDGAGYNMDIYRVSDGANVGTTKFYRGAETVAGNAQLAGIMEGRSESIGEMSARFLDEMRANGELPANDTPLDDLGQAMGDAAASAGVRVNPQSADVLQGDNLLSPRSTQAEADATFAQASGQAAPDFGGNPFRVNFRKIASEDDIRSIIAQMVEARPDVIDAARRGVQNWDATAAEASGIVSDPGFVERLIARQPGTAFNAGEVQAMAMLLDSSAQRVRTLAEAVRESPTAANIRAFHDMMTVHGAIDSTFMGARAEAGRALQIFRRQMTGDADAAARIDALLGSGSVQDVARWQELADELLSADVDSFGAIARKVPEMNTAASVRSLVQSAMLTNPSTHMAAVIGNGMGLLFETGFRALAPALRRAGGNSEGVIRDGEAMAMLAGQAQAFRDILALRRRVQSTRAAIPAAREALADGVSPQSLGAAIGGVAGAAMRPQEGGFAEFVQRSAPEMNRAEATSEGVFPVARRSTNPVVRGLAAAAQTFDGTVKGVTGEIDRVFRYAAQSAGINASAYRQAMQEVASGALDPANAVARQRELVAAPTREMMDEAEGMASEITFTRNHEFWTAPSGMTVPGFGQQFLTLRRGIEGLGDAGPVRSVIQGYLAGATMPFVHTPGNIMSYALRNSPMAPLMRRYQEDIAYGGARAEVAQTRMVVGSMMLWTAYSLAAEGHITGGGAADPQQRQSDLRQGWQPDSIRIGDTWYSINRLDPLGSLLSMAGSMADIFVNTDWEDKEAFDQASEIVPNMILGVGNVFLNKSMLTGIQDLVQAISDPDRYGEQFMQGRLTAIIPAAVGLAERMVDPYQRDPMVITNSDRTGTPEGAAIEAMESFLQAARARTPGLSESLPIRRDLWGREMMQVSGMGPIWEMLSPSRASHSRWTPIDSELQRLGEYPSMPQRRLTVPDDLRTGPEDNGQRSLSDHPDIYNRILEIRGELVLDRLNAMVEGEGFEGQIYRTLSDVDQYEMIREILEEGGKAAREQVIEEYYDRFTDMATRRRAAEQVPLP